MRFSYNWLQSFFRKKLPKPEKLAEFLSMHSFEINEIKKIDSDFVLDIDILPNRAPDCLSHLGVAREISAILNYKFQIVNLKLIENKELKIKDFISVEIKNKNICSRYVARAITGIKIGFSPKWIREKLKVCGLRSINNVVDIVNYIMLETGQPLHVFDFERIEGKNSKPKKIIVRFAKEKEKIITLDEEKYDLDENILIISDEKEPLAIAGIKGGKKAEINDKTKIIVLESANFDPLVIRQGSKRIDLKTESSQRFEYSLDPNLAEFAIDRTAFLIQKIAGGKILQGLIDIYPQKILPKRIKLDLNYVENLLGIKISEREIKEILEKLGFKIKNWKLKILDVIIPTFRLDVSIAEDLIEEIGRIYGYQKIPAQFPITALIPPEKNLDIFWENIIKDILKEVGFTEVYNYSFISENDAKNFNFHLIEIENPTSLEFQYLRPSLIPNLLKNVERNQKNFPEIRIFELGKIFKKNNKEIEEKKMLTGLIMTKEGFYQLKGVIDLLLNKLGISNIWYKETKPPFWSSQKCAEIKIDNKEVGFLGEISPRILENLKIKSKVTIFEIDFEKLSKLASEEYEYQPISRFPAAIRDLAILVPRTVKVEDVLNKIETIGGSLICDIDLFDIYEGEELPTNKKNLAFHIIYQAEDRTLTSEDIDKIQNKIIKSLEEEIDWEVRK